MNADCTSLLEEIGAVCFMGVSVYSLGAGVASTIAYTTTANRDVSYGFLTAGDTLLTRAIAP